MALKLWSRRQRMREARRMLFFGVVLMAAFILLAIMLGDESAAGDVHPRPRQAAGVIMMPIMAGGFLLMAAYHFVMGLLTEPER